MTGRETETHEGRDGRIDRDGEGQDRGEEETIGDKRGDGQTGELMKREERDRHWTMKTGDKRRQ